jgi:hypothetical protein
LGGRKTVVSSKPGATPKPASKALETAKTSSPAQYLLQNVGFGRRDCFSQRTENVGLLFAIGLCLNLNFTGTVWNVLLFISRAQEGATFVIEQFFCPCQHRFFGVAQLF